MGTLSSTVPSTNPYNVGISSPVSSLSAQSPQVQPTGSAGVLSLQMEAAEDAAFEHEIHSTSVRSAARTASGTTVGTIETASRDSSKETSEATIALEAKEAKRRGRPRKAQKKSGVGIRRRIYLPDDEAKVIQTAKAMGNLMLLVGVCREKGTDKKNVEEIANLQNRALPDQSGRKDSIRALMRFVVEAQRLNQFCDEYCLSQRRLANLQWCRPRLRQGWQLIEKRRSQ